MFNFAILVYELGKELITIQGVVYTLSDGVQHNTTRHVVWINLLTQYW